MAEKFVPDGSTDSLLYQEYIARESNNRDAQHRLNERQKEFMKEQRMEIDYYKKTPTHILYGPGYRGYGNGTTETTTRPSIIVPSRRQRPRHNQRELRIPKRKILEQSMARETLVPIRIEIEDNRFILRDVFTWNLNDSSIPLEYFAEVTCQDCNIPSSQIGPAIQRVMAEQLSHFHSHPSMPPDVEQGESIMDENGNLLPYTAYNDEDMRIMVKLDITIGSLNLTDGFEWDINSPSSNPELFAQALVADLSLPGEFVTAIAHDIREQSQMYTKCLFLTGHPFDGRIIEDDDVRYFFLPTIHAVFKRAQPTSGPAVYALDEEDESNRRTRSREGERESHRGRRRRIFRARKGVTLPNVTEVRKTHRTVTLYTGIPGTRGEEEEKQPEVSKEEYRSVSQPKLLVKLKFKNILNVKKLANIRASPNQYRLMSSVSAAAVSHAVGRRPNNVNVKRDYPTILEDEPAVSNLFVSLFSIIFANIKARMASFLA